MTVYSLGSSKVYISVGLKNSQTICEELLHHINVSLSPAPSLFVSVYISAKNIIGKRTSRYADAVGTA